MLLLISGAFFKCEAQTAKELNFLVKIGENTNRFYSDQCVLMVIEVPNRDSAKIDVEISQGSIYSIDGGNPTRELFQVGGLKQGKAIIKVYKRNARGREFLGEREFPVFEKLLTREEKIYRDLTPKPIITFCGKTKGFITLDSLKKVKLLNVSLPYNYRLNPFDKLI